MHPIKKNTSLIFLLFLVAMPVLFSIYTIAAKIIIEHEMEEKLERENLQTIELDAASVIWLKKNKELLVNGELFDVKTITRKGNTLIISGLFDSQEKKLKQQLKAFDGSQNRSASANNSLLFLFFTTYYQQIDSMDLFAAFVILKKQNWQRSADKTSKLYHEIIIPPPRFV